MSKTYLKFDKVKYPDGVGCSIYRAQSEDDECGMCFDFSEEEIPALQKIFKDIESAPAELYEPDLEHEAHIQKMKEREKTWWYKLYNLVERLSIQITPFKWSLHISGFDIDNTIECKVGVMMTHGGMSIGPIRFTW